MPDEIIFVVAAAVVVSVVVVGSMMCRLWALEATTATWSVRWTRWRCICGLRNFFVILLSDFMPGSYIHKINHSHNSNNNNNISTVTCVVVNSRKVKSVRKFLPVLIRMFIYGICRYLTLNPQPMRPRKSRNAQHIFISFAKRLKESSGLLPLTYICVLCRDVPE